MICPLAGDKNCKDSPIKEGAEEHFWEKEFMEIYTKEIGILDEEEHRRLQAIEAKRIVPKVDYMEPKLSDGQFTKLPSKVTPADVSHKEGGSLSNSPSKMTTPNKPPA